VVGRHRVSVHRLEPVAKPSWLACALGKVLIGVYALCGLLSAGAGVLLAGYLGAVDTGMGSPYLLQTVAAVVIGGTQFWAEAEGSAAQ